MGFFDRVHRLPRLGLGVSTEYGAGDAPRALDVVALHDAPPAYARFLEIGVETAKGLDRHARAWVARGLPTTYHYLDVNLDAPEDFDEPWLDEVRAIAATIRPAWLCGDAGMWHLGAVLRRACRDAARDRVGDVACPHQHGVGGRIGGGRGEGPAGGGHRPGW
jgi:hypothetical protein